MDANGGIDAVNRGLTELHAFIAGDLLFSDGCRIGLITFSDTAEELLPLSNPSDVQAMPRWAARGIMSNYGEAFNLLRVVISRDIANMKSQGIQVYRPLVFFITDGEPLDDWEASYRALTDKNVNPQAPHIIFFAVDGANPAVIGKIGNKAACMANQWVDLCDVLKETLRSLPHTIANDKADDDNWL